MIARVTVSEPTFNATASNAYIVNITLGAAIGTQQIQADLLQSDTGALDYVKNKLESFIVTASNFDTDITEGPYKAYIFVPYNFHITAVEAAMHLAPVGSSAIYGLTVDGVSILSTPITIESGAKTSLTAAVQPVVITQNMAAGTFIDVAILQKGVSTAGRDPEITVKGYRINTI